MQRNNLGMFAFHSFVSIICSQSKHHGARLWDGLTYKTARAGCRCDGFKKQFSGLGFLHSYMHLLQDIMMVASMCGST